MTSNEKRERLREILEAVANEELEAGAKRAESLLWMASNVDCIPEGRLAIEEVDLLALHDKVHKEKLVWEELNTELRRIRFYLP